MVQTVYLTDQRQREIAKALIDAAPKGGVVRVSGPTRSLDQNALMHSLLSSLSRAKPEGRRHTPEVWKALMMHACGHQVQFEHGIDGLPFPIGFRSSRLTVAQMSDLIEFIYEYGARHGVVFHSQMEDA